MHRNKTLTHLARIAAVALTATCLSGCFDLGQKVAIGRDGSGHYEMALTAEGLMGEALKDGDILQVKRGHVVNRTVIANSRVTRIASVDFKSLGDLTLPDEAISVRVMDHSWFGLGPTQAVFNRSFLVQNAKRRGERRGSSNDNADAGVAAAIFGSHTYTFSVTLPGSIDWIAPLKIGNLTVKPVVTGDYFQHTVTWRVPLFAMLTAKLVRFEVGFSAYGTFGDAQSMPDGSL